MTNASVMVDQSQVMGILITNGEFTAFCDAPHFTFCDGKSIKPAPAPLHVKVAAGNVGALKIVNSAFWGPAAQIAVTEGSGTVTFSQCHFDSWDHWIGPNGTYVHKGAAAISQLGGNLIVSESDFTGRHGPADTTNELELGPKVAKTIFTSNMVTGTLNIVRNEGRLSKVIVRDNLDDSPMDPAGEEGDEYDV